MRRVTGIPRSREATTPSRPAWTLVDVLLARRVSSFLPRWLDFLETGLVLAGSALVITTASVHLQLWLAGYRHVPRLGVAFLGQAATGLIGGPLIAFARHLIFLAGGAMYMAASAVALVLSATVGFLGIHDSLAAPWAGWSIGVEIAGFALFSAAGALLLFRR